MTVIYVLTRCVDEFYTLMYYDEGAVDIDELTDHELYNLRLALPSHVFQDILSRLTNDPCVMLWEAVHENEV